MATPDKRPAELGPYQGKYPRSTAEFANLAKVVEDYVLPGYLPERPIIGPADSIRAQGSCFAENVVAALKLRGMNAKIMGVNETINSPTANEFFFRYISGRETKLAHPIHAAAFPIAEAANFAQKFREANLLILTLGVAPYVALRSTGLPVFNVDPNHPQDFVVIDPTVGETKKTIASIVAMVGEINPNLKLVLTLSPVPLNRSAQPSAVAADCISKSTLRAAVAELMRDPASKFAYWPSFEIIRWLGAHLPPVFGADDGLTRHVNKDIVGLVIDLFLKYYAGLEPAPMKDN